MSRPSSNRRRVRVGISCHEEDFKGELTGAADDPDKLSPTQLPCLICGQCAFPGKEKGPIKEEEGGHSSNERQLLTCLLTMFQVKLDKKAMISSDKGEGGFPFYCRGCKEQLQLLLKLQIELKELEMTLQANTRIIKESMEKSEELFRNRGIYDKNGHYYNIRVKILGDKATLSGMQEAKRMPEVAYEKTSDQDEEYESEISLVRKSTRKRKCNASFSTDYILEDQNSGEDIEVESIKVEVDDDNLINDNNDDTNEHDYVEDYSSSDSDSSFSPGSVADVVSDVEQDSGDDSNSDDESCNLLNDYTKVIGESKSEENFKRPKPKIVIENSDGEQEYDSDETAYLLKYYLTTTGKSKPKENLKRPKPLGVEDESDMKKQSKRNAKKEVPGPRGSYMKDKVIKNPTTGDCEYLNVKFEKLADGKFKCMECREIVWNNNTIRKHTIRSHTDRCVCHICGLHKGSNTDLNKHIKEVHEGKARKPLEKKLECPICGKPFRHKTTLELHKTTHYNKEDRIEAEARGEKLLDQKGTPHQCGICGKIFGNIWWLNKHEKIKHPKTEEERSETQRICPECGKTISDGYFKRHMDRYHSDLDISVRMPHACIFCEKRFFTVHRLIQHKRAHTGERPFKCTVCDKGFSEKRKLKFHIMQKHENVKPFACTNCPAAFVNSYKLRRHVATVHERKNQKDWNKKK